MRIFQFRGFQWVGIAISAAMLPFWANSNLSSLVCHGNVQGTGLSRFMQVKAWRLRLSLEYGRHEVKRETETNIVRTQTIDEDLIAQVDFRLVKAKTFDSAHWNWKTEAGSKPTGQMSASGNFVDKSVYGHDGHEEWKRQQFKSGGVVDGEAGLRIDSKTGQVMVICGFQGGQLTAEISTHQGKLPATVVPATMFVIPDVGYWEEQAPAAGFLIKSGARTINPMLPLQDRPRPVTARWTLLPWDQEPPGEASYEYVDKNWQPDPMASGSILVKWKGNAEKVRVTLSGISHEPGTCLNSIENGDEDDLRLESGGGWLVQSEGSGADKKFIAMHLVPKKGEETTSIGIKATDYGASGKLRVEVFMDGGWKDAKHTSTGKGTANVPYDLDGNHIADSYEREYKVEGVAANSDDDDVPVGDGKRKGDGLTLYEEYRGLLEGGNHLRTNPKVKDLFVSDQTGGLATEGAQLFAAASELKVHYQLTADELGESRVVNRNHKEGPHIVDQHGIPVVKGGPDSDAEAIPVDEDSGFGPPVMTSKITLPSGTSYTRPGGAVDRDAEENISTVAHELGHSVGIAHHGEGVAFVCWYYKVDGAGKRELYEAEYNSETKKAQGKEVKIRVFREVDGKEITDSAAGPGEGVRPIVLALVVSQYGGQQNCLSRYSDADAYYPPGKPNSLDRWIPNDAEWVRRNALCSGKAGTGINAPDHKPWPRYGNAAVGNCKSQIVVSDKYATK